MASGMGDKIKGAGEVVSGKVKQAAGDVTDDPKLKVEGDLDELRGKARQTGGDVKEEVTERL